MRPEIHNLVQIGGKMSKVDRRYFTRTVAKGVGATTLMGHLPLACAMSAPQSERKLGVALVGLGSYSTYQLAPALQDTEHCYLAGIVTGTPSKAKEWSKIYGIPKENCFDYANFDSIIDNKTIDVVYVVLPNSMHAEFSIRAANAGKHVICEKPMAMNVAECDAIISACERNGVRLRMGYRLHSEPYTKAVKRFVREKTFGDVLYVSADAGYRSTSNPNQWRLDKKLSGGGALVNMGVYAIQSAIYATGENPITVQAQEYSTRPEYFKETDETITAQFEFSNGATANIMTSHNVRGNRLHASCTKGWFELDPASTYIPLSGSTSNGPLQFDQESQQKLQMDDFARHILFDAPNVAPGEMGKRDMMIVESVYRSIREGGKKQILDFEKYFGFGHS